MKRSIIVVVTALTLVAASPLAAQQNELGVFVSLADLDSTVESDPDLGDATIDFESQLGYGVSYNRYFGDAFSIEFAAQQINSDAEVTFGGDSDPDLTFDFGSVDLMAYTAVAQLHFGSGAFVPYIGGGAAMVSGSFDINDELEPDEAVVDFESEITFAANAGVDFRFGPSFAINVDAKYIPYEAMEEGLEDEAIDLNPLIISAGIKLRF